MLFCLQDIGPASQTNQRLKALRDLCETVHTRRLEEVLNTDLLLQMIFQLVLIVL